MGNVNRILAFLGVLLNDAIHPNGAKKDQCYEYRFKKYKVTIILWLLIAKMFYNNF